MVSTVLHVGCGGLPVHPFFRGEGWRELRLDINPEVKPDIVASITDMQAIPSESIDAVYSAHNLEHLYPHEVRLALAEFNRVLSPTGAALIILPDLQSVAALVAQDRLDEPAYVSPAGPITPLDIIYGHRAALAQGNLYMAHRTGFTETSLRADLLTAGFRGGSLQRILDIFELRAVAFKHEPDAATLAVWHQGCFAPPGKPAA